MLELRQKFRIANIVMWGKVMPSKCPFVDIWSTPYLQESWANNSFWPTSLRCLPKEELFWNNRRVQLIVEKHSVSTLQVWRIPTYQNQITTKTRWLNFHIGLLRVNTHKFRGHDDTQSSCPRLKLQWVLSTEASNVSRANNLHTLDLDQYDYTHNIY